MLMPLRRDQRKTMGATRKKTLVGRMLAFSTYDTPAERAGGCRARLRALLPLQNLVV